MRAPLPHPVQRPRPRTAPAAKATIMLHGGRSTPADAGPSNGVDEQEAGGSATSLHTLPTAMTYRMNPRRFGGGRRVLDNRHGPTVAALPSLVHPGALQQDRHSSRGRDAIWRGSFAGALDLPWQGSTVSLHSLRCRRGQSLVVHAIHEGREAAREIDRYPTRARPGCPERAGAGVGARRVT